MPMMYTVQWLSSYFRLFDLSPISMSSKNYKDCLPELNLHRVVFVPMWFLYKTDALREKCPNNTELFLVRIFPHSEWIRRNTKYLSVFSSNAGKYKPEITPYLDTFHAVRNPIGEGFHWVAFCLNVGNISNKVFVLQWIFTYMFEKIINMAASKIVRIMEKPFCLFHCSETKFFHYGFLQ